MGDVWKCTLCYEFFEAAELTSHYNVYHPELNLKRDVVPDVWPDGEPVVYEDLNEIQLQRFIYPDSHQIPGMDWSA